MESLIQQFVGHRRIDLKGRNRLNSMHRSARRRGGGTAILAPDQSPLSKENEVDTMSNPTGIADLEMGQREVGEQEARLLPTHKTRLYFWRSWQKLSVALIILQALIITVLVLRKKAHNIPDERGIESTEEITTRAGPVVEFLVNQNPSELHHLIMVPGHGVTMTESLDGADSKDGDWFLLDYQKNKDVPQALITHMRVGLDELDSDEQALLLFSGGKTRVVAGPKSEGESYYFVADHYDWWGKPDLRARAATEDFARDSFENLLFSICRFKEITGNYPDKITIVGYDFKEERFETLHRAAILFPSESFRYIGLHPEGRFDHAAAETGERESALEPYRVDPYGCAPNGPLEKKRAARNPFHRTPPYTLVCPEMRKLLEWCGPGYFEGGLPWSQ